MTPVVTLLKDKSLLLRFHVDERNGAQVVLSYSGNSLDAVSVRLSYQEARYLRAQIEQVLIASGIGLYPM